MALLSSDGDLDTVDLLKEAFGGRHPSTRPPRLQLPTSLKYMTKHKYPQRLDCACGAGGGEAAAAGGG